MLKAIVKYLILLSVILLTNISLASELTDDYVDMASEWATSGDYGKALDNIHNALKIEPSNRELLKIKLTLEQIVNPDKFSGSGQVFSMASYDAGNCLESGISKYNTKDYDGALAEFQRYLNYNPKSDFAYTMLAKCYLDLGNPNLALNYIEKALNILDNTENKMLQGQILYEKGYYVQAKNIFESLKVTVQTSELYEYIGLCEYKLNNYAEALNNIDKAIILRDDVQRLDSLYNEIKVKIEAVD